MPPHLARKLQAGAYGVPDQEPCHETLRTKADVHLVAYEVFRTTKNVVRRQV